MILLVDLAFSVNKPCVIATLLFRLLILICKKNLFFLKTVTGLAEKQWVETNKNVLK